MARGRSFACQQPGPCLPIPSRKDTDTMQPTSTLPSTRRVPTLDGARSRGIYVQFYDPDGRRYGIPTYPYRWAPKHLYTTRQLRARGLRPGGQSADRPDPVAPRPARRLPLPRRPGPAQEAGHPRPARRDRQGAPRPAHLPDLRHREAVLHPPLPRRMPRLHRKVNPA